MTKFHTMNENICLTHIALISRYDVRLPRSLDEPINSDNHEITIRRELLRVLKKGSNPQEEKSNLHEEKKEPAGRKNKPAARKKLLVNLVASYW